jgi:MFS family permease
MNQTLDEEFGFVSRNYGWVMVPVAALAMVATLPGRTHGLGMITERLLADDSFGITRTTYGEFNLWATLLGALFCLPCGWLIDRFGLRSTLTVTLLALAGVVMWMTVLTGPDQLFCAILLTRGFGQSALSVISITIVGKWFRGRLSVPMAVYSALLSLGFAGASQLAKPFADADWRVVWGTMGWSLLGLAPLAWLLTRDPFAAEKVLPDDRGCCDPDETLPSHAGFTLAQALGTPTFWAFGLSISLVGLIGAGVSLFNESIIVQQGFTKETFYDVLTWTFIVGLAAKLPVAWLARHYSLSRLQAGGMLLLAASIAWLPFIHDFSQLAAYAVVMGISGTTTTVLFFTIWGQAFGQAHLGQIQSAAQMMTVVASAIGPVLLAECFARTDSYALILQVLAGLASCCAAFAWFVRVPKPSDAPSAEPTAPVLQLATSQET